MNFILIFKANCINAATFPRNMSRYNHCLRKSDKNSWDQKCLKIKGQDKLCLDFRLSQQRSVVLSHLVKEYLHVHFFAVGSLISQGSLLMCKLYSLFNFRITCPCSYLNEYLILGKKNPRCLLRLQIVPPWNSFAESLGKLYTSFWNWCLYQAVPIFPGWKQILSLSFS